MRERATDLWSVPPEGQIVLRCITTNGEIHSDGTAVMGRGCARAAAERYPGIDRVLGGMISSVGNVVHDLRGVYGPHPSRKADLFSFPTKYEWRLPSDMDLIIRSAKQLVEKVKVLRVWEEYDEVWLPRPGCGAGELDWSTVKGGIGWILGDNRFVAISQKEEDFA